MPVLMRARRRDEAHRAATPLELFFDLCFVVADRPGGPPAGARRWPRATRAHGILGYLMVFFAIWWAWMNFTWFASAYDTDDALYRVVTLVQIAGVLVLAAGVPAGLRRQRLHGRLARLCDHAAGAWSPSGCGPPRAAGAPSGGPRCATPSG